MIAFAVASLHTGAGKTTVAAGLMSVLARRGRRVQGFKAGPDFIDPTHHERATGRPSRNLDLWLVGPAALRRLWARSARAVNVVEGMMGLFDGAPGGGGSTADVAKLLGLPVVLVVDGSGLAQTAGALLHGLSTFDPKLRVAGVIFNRVASAGHYELLRRSTRLPSFGWVAPDPAISIAERHLGLVPARERGADWARIGDAVARHVDVDALLRAARVPDVSAPAVKRPPASVRIGVARDEAFSFSYEDNLELLEEAGAGLDFFSPLRGDWPRAGALLLGGGFPELFRFPAHRKLREAVRAGMPVYAECGGLMYLAGQGLVPGRVRMTETLSHFGYAEATARRDTLLLRRGESVRGHEFHRSEWSGPANAYVVRHGERSRVEGFARGGLLATYVHVHFASKPVFARRLVRAAQIGDSA